MVRRTLYIYADWAPLGGPRLMGELHATPARGKEVFSFTYASAWLNDGPAQVLDPGLGLFGGPQFASGPNFGLFLDSSPDRWGRVLMRRREAQRARHEDRAERRLVESDYLLGVHDGTRMGALRFKLDPDGPLLDDDAELAAPPWTTLRTLEHASLSLEADGAEDRAGYAEWLRLLVAPGSSLGGARPKASVVDADGQLWIAKFPSRSDERDVGAWEMVVHQLAMDAGIWVPDAQLRRFNGPHHTYLSRRFDRTGEQRHHFASAMTLLERQDGDDGAVGASYLELAEVLMSGGARPREDLEALWCRVVFSMCVSNTDDHLRNHGFLLDDAGWILSPAYDMNPSPFGEGLSLNVSETDNAQDLDLARAVAPYFRVHETRQEELVEQVKRAVSGWRGVANSLGISRAEQERMVRAFRLAES